MELALHHVEEDGDGGFTQLRLGKERHFQHGADHFRDELDLVLTWNKETCYSEIGGGAGGVPPWASMDQRRRHGWLCRRMPASWA